MNLSLVHKASRREARRRRSILGISLLSAAAVTFTATGLGTQANAAPGSVPSAKAVPVLLGVALQDNGPTAAAKGPQLNAGLAGGFLYVNNVLGGINGRPLKLEICRSDGSAAAEVNCANNFVSKGVVAVFDSNNTGITAQLPILQAARIPVYGVNPGSPAQAYSLYAYTFGTPLAVFAAGPLQVFKDKGLNRVSLTISKGPAQEGYVNAYLKPAAGKLGLELSVPYYNASAVDWNVVANTLLASGPQVTGVLIASPNDCTTLLKAIRSNGFTGPVQMGSCTEYMRDAPQQAVNTFQTAGFWTTPLKSAAPPIIRKQMAAYTAAMTKAGYPNVDELGNWAVNAFSGLVTFRDVLVKYGKAPYAKQQVAAAFPKVRNYQSFMGAVQNCDGKQIPGTRACNSSVLMLTVGAGGKITTVDPKGFTKVPASTLS